MKMSSLSGNGALKLLLLLTSLSHYSAGLVAGADPAKDICDSIATNKSVNFFLIGHNSKGFRLLITAKPDYLVYELPADSVHDDWVSLYDVKPVPLKEYYPVLFENTNLTVLLLDSQPISALQSITVNDFTTVYLNIIYLHHKQLYSYNMNASTLDVFEDFFDPPILPDQQFVPMTFTDSILCKNSFYSFRKDGGSLRSLYKFEYQDEILYLADDYTCKGNKSDTMVLRDKYRKCDSKPGYEDWDWSESPKGWAYMPDSEKNSIRFNLFIASKQQVFIFDQNVAIERSDAFSIVSTKSYGDFFWCHSGTPGPSTSTQPSTTTKTLTNTSSQLVKSTTSTSFKPFGPTEKTKFPRWIIILIVVIILVVIIIIVIALVWYYDYGGKKSYDPKPDKVAFTKVMDSSVKHAQGNSNQLVSASKVSIQSSMVTPSKGPEAKVQGFKAKK